MASFWEVQKVPGSGDLLDDMMTYVSQPGGLGRHPAVIVAHEGLGLTENMQSVADRSAVSGYFAVAPALFHREGTTEGVRGSNPVFSPEDPAGLHRAVVANMRDENIILDINTTIQWLQRHPRVLGDRIGILGFCMGGRVAYLTAAACPGLSAASVFYGNPNTAYGDTPPPITRTASIQCPVLGSYGEDGRSPNMDQLQTIEAELRKHGVVHDFKVYPKVGQRFFSHRPDSFHEHAAEDGWARTLDWFQKYLSPVTTAV